MQPGDQPWLAPGFLVLLADAPGTLFPPIGVYLALRYLSKAGVEENILQKFIGSPGLRSLSALVILTIYVSLRRIGRAIRRRNDRKSLGPDVVEAPRIKKRLPWNIDWIPEAMNARRTGEYATNACIMYQRLETEYIGEMFRKNFVTHGHTFNLKIFGGDQVRFCSSCRTHLYFELDVHLRTRMRQSRFEYRVRGL